MTTFMCNPASQLFLVILVPVVNAGFKLKQFIYLALLLQTNHKEAVTKYQGQLKEARQLIEQLETDKAMGIAEVKQQMHVTMESKDQEFQKLRASLAQIKSENEELAEKVQQLEKAGERCSHLKMCIFSN